jgi:tetratricopeptide (TPR) repeat protein
MADEQSTQKPSSERAVSDRLETWGEIAAYVGREIRTVQRWEKTMGLPVRRLVAGPDKQSRVFALKSELDAWWQKHEVLRNAPDSSEESAISTPRIVNRAPLPAQEPVPTRSENRVSRHRTLLWVTLAAGVVVVLVVVIPRVVVRLWPPKVVLGVQPFRNLGGPTQDYIAAGLTEEMVARFAQLHPERMSVVRLNPGGARSSAIKTTYVLQGTVRRFDDEVGVTAQLTQSSNQAVVWGNSYERDVKDLLRLQTELADAIASEVFKNIPHAASPEREVNREAYLAHLEGRYFWNQRRVDTIQKAITLFQKSTNVDPTYAPAYAGLADCYELLGSAPYTALPPRDAFPKAEAAARKALQLDESLAEAHVSLGYAFLAYEWDFAAADREFRRALHLRPSYAPAHQFYGYLLTAEGRLPEAIEERKKAVDLDPLSPLMASALGEAYYEAREYDLAIAQNQRALELDPSYAIALVNIGRAYEQKGMHSEAQATFQKILATTPDDPAVLSLLAHDYAVSGRRSDALQIVQQLQSLAAHRYVPALYFALIYTGLGDKDQAFRWMNAAVEEKTEYLVYLGAEPLADPLRDDPRFAELAKRVGLQLR